MLIGITGGIGSGKTTVVKLFSKYKNIIVYYADFEAKKLMNTSKEIKTKIIEEFSGKAYNKNGLNREYLSKIVFENSEKLYVLNAIIHPEIHKHLESFINRHQGKEYILYESAILFENRSDTLCNKIITITAPEEIRIQRVMKRDKTSREAVINRMKNQWSDIKKKLQSNYLIVNLEFNNVEKQVTKIYNKLTKSKS